MCKKRDLAVIVVSLSLASSSAFGFEAGAKALFEGDGTSIRMSRAPEGAPDSASTPGSKASTKRSTAAPNVTRTASYGGIQYWIELDNGGGTTKRVTTSHQFRSGDRIKVKVNSNTGGYLYVFNLGSTGRENVLYPPPNTPPGMISARTVYTIPSTGFIRFDDNPGTEEIGIVLAANPLPLGGSAPAGTANPAPRSSQGIPVSYSKCTGTKDLVAETDFSCIGSQYGSKDLVVEEDTSSAMPAEYAVAPVRDLDSGKTLSVKFRLIHR